jgi:glycerol uptake facilitator-like aquaporin
MVDEKTHALGHVGVAITFGLVIMAMIYAVGHVSGAYFNVRGHLRVCADAALSLVARGRLVGGAADRCGRRGGRTPRLARRHRACRGDSALRQRGQSFLWEIVLSAILMFVIMAVATDTRAIGEAAAIAIGE